MVLLWLVHKAGRGFPRPVLTPGAVPGGSKCQMDRQLLIHLPLPEEGRLPHQPNKFRLVENVVISTSIRYVCLRNLETA